MNNALNLIESLTRLEDHSSIDLLVESPPETLAVESTYEPSTELVTTSDETANHVPIKKVYSISDVEIYNKIMFTLAKTGQTHKIIRLFNKMRTRTASYEPIQPNLNSYVAAIQSIGYNLNTNPNFDANSARLSIERILFDVGKAKVTFFVDFFFHIIII